jgi:hypothetical protein
MDACYAYNWGTNQASTIQTSINNGRLAGANVNFVPIAVIPHGRNGEGWNLASTGYMTGPDLSGMSSWWKSTYSPSVTTGNPGKDIILFGNWNEYGEGSHFCPTKLGGFEYLDRIRSAFTVQANVTNQVPTVGQKARVNILYANAWDGRVWKFDSFFPDAEGWTSSTHISGLAQSKGFLNGTIAGTDPVLFSPDGYSINGGIYNTITVRMKNSSYGTVARIYFKRATDTAFTQAMSKSFAIIPNDQAYTTYVIDMSSVAGWSTEIRQLRFDPVDNGNVTTGSFSIDSITITDGP